MTEQQLASKIKATWKHLTAVSGLLSGDTYSVWESLDGKLQIQIHDRDNELVCLHIVETDEWLFNARDVLRLAQRLSDEYDSS